MQKLTKWQLEKLIDCVKDKPFMYNKFEKNYKNIEVRDKTWQEIAAKIEADEKVCKTAWRSLRDQYNKCLKEKRGTGKESPDYAPKRTYKFFETLSFLEDSFEPRTTSTNYEAEAGSSTQEDEVESKCQDTTDTVFWNEFGGMTEECKEEEHNLPKTPPPPPSSSSSPNHSSGKSFLSFLSFVSSLVANNVKDGPQLDGCDNFFLGVSSTVKNCNLTPSQLANLQCKVMIVVSKELEALKDTT